jgi:hypothetical protein
MNAWTLLLSVGAAALLLSAAACDEPKKTDPPVKDAAAVSTASAKASAAPAPVRMPEVTLDQAHVQMGMDDVQLNLPSFSNMLKNMIAKYPVSQPDKVIMNVARQNKIEGVTPIVYALFDAGAKAIEIRTKARGTFAGQIVITPDTTYAKKAQPCTYAGMVLKDLAPTFWHIKGGTAKKYPKGMAGPDFTAMHEVWSKEVGSCSSTLFYFSADEGVEWGHAFDIATSVVAAKYNIDTYVLLREIPTAGKPVKVGP